MGWRKRNWCQSSPQAKCKCCAAHNWCPGWWILCLVLMNSRWSCTIVSHSVSFGRGEDMDVPTVYGENSCALEIKISTWRMQRRFSWNLIVEKKKKKKVQCYLCLNHRSHYISLFRKQTEKRHQHKTPPQVTCGTNCNWGILCMAFVDSGCSYSTANQFISFTDTLCWVLIGGKLMCWELMSKTHVLSING